MIIKKIEHISVNVSDIDKATKFYRDILGFAYLETVSDEEKDLVYYQIPGGSRLELFNYHGKAIKAPEVKSDFELLGYVHLAFEVDDVDKWVEYLKGAEVPIAFGPIDLPQLGMRVCLFTDPDGNVFEICKEM